MQVRLALFGTALFFFGFLLSLFLGMVSGLPLDVVFLRALILGIFLIGVAGLIRFIFRQYLAGVIDLSLFMTHTSPKDNNDAMPDWQTDQDSAPTVGELTRVDLEEKDGSWGSSLKDPAFSGLDKDLSLGNDDGLTKKATKDTFQDEDPQIMAETIRNAMAKEEMKGDADKKEQANG